MASRSDPFTCGPQVLGHVKRDLREPDLLQAGRKACLAASERTLDPFGGGPPGRLEMLAAVPYTRRRCSLGLARGRFRALPVFVQ